MKLKLYIFLCFSLSLFTNLEAFPLRNVKLKILSLEQGLPGVSVQCIWQDHIGLMWFGVEGNGACMYNGRNFNVFKNTDKDTASISNNFVSKIVEDKKGRLWFATLYGLNLFNRNTRTFKRILFNPDNDNSIARNSLTALTEYDDGTIWIGTENGISIYDPDNDKFVNILFSPKGSIAKRLSIFCIYSDKLNNVWIGTQNDGIFYFDAQSIKLFLRKWKTDSDKYSFNSLKPDKKYDMKSDPAKKLTSNQIWALKSSNDGYLFVGTQLGLFKLEIRTGKFQKIIINKPEMSLFNNATINTLYYDANKVLWVGSTSDGLAMIDTKSGNCNYLTMSYPTNSPLKSSSIRDIFEDKSGIVWIATKFAGLHMYDRRQENFEHIKAIDGPLDGLNDNFVMTLYENPKNIIWIGTRGGGINRYDRISGSFTYYHYNLKIHGIKRSNRIHDIVGFGPKGMFVGTVEALEWFEPYTNTVEKINSYEIYTLRIDNDGLLWVATFYNGLMVYDAKTRKRVHLKTLHLKLFDNPDLLINRIFCDNEGRIWLGTRSEGILLYDKKMDTLVSFEHNPNDSKTLSGNMIREIMQDSKGTIWVGTKSNGLNRFNPINNTFERVIGDRDLSGRTIYNILEDNYGNLWMGTHNGIAKYNITTKHVDDFNLDYGLQGKIYEINADLKAADGSLLFGGQNGLNIFQPDQITKREYLAPIIISKFKVFDSVKDLDITTNKTYTLSRKDNFISFEFAILDYSSPLQNQYAYRLEGIDKEWVYSGNRAYVSYTNLPPGKYIFSVKGANIDEVWNENGVNISLIIPKPIWMKGWFKFFVILILFTFFVTAYYLRINALRKRELKLISTVNERTKDLQEANEELKLVSEQINRQNIELELHRENLETLVNERTVDLEKAKEKAEESDRLKSAFLANMSHEIRTPLNAIMGFSTLITSETFNKEELAGINQIIQLNGNTLMQLINDIIDISMIEANQVVIQKQPFVLKKLIEVLNESMNALLIIQGKTNIQIKIEIDDNLINESIVSDFDRIKQVFNCLFDNALKFTKEGFIKYGFKLDENHSNIIFFIFDTGIGIDKKYHKEIFNRFRKIELNNSEIYRGTGLGLSISKNLVSFLGGHIWVESNLGEGTTFYFDIPLEISSVRIPNETNLTRLSIKDINWKGTTILVAEDEDSNYKVLKSMLKPTQIGIERAFNGKEAVEMCDAAHQKYRLVLMDIKMPEMTGSEATKIIKAKYNIPVIAQTAYATSEEVRKFSQTGFDDYIVKPIVYAILVTKMAKYLTVDKAS